MDKETKLRIYRTLKENLIEVLEQIDTLISEDYIYVKCSGENRLVTQTDSSHPSVE